MMPIVDPHVGLSRDEFPLDDYLTQSDEFHVLRMVAVQQPQLIDSTIDNLHYYRDMSTTRGYGGFPNGVVAYCNLAEADSLDKLFSDDSSSVVRGVHYAPSQNQQTGEPIRSSTQTEPLLWTKKLEMLSSKEMSLDLTLSIDECDLINAIVKSHSDIRIMVTLQNWAQWLETKNTSLFKKQIELLAQCDNINIKLCDSAFGTNSSYKSIQKLMINRCANRFGYDRIMFASSFSSSGGASMSIDQQWASYVKATDKFTAIQRDKVFRSNAIRLYRL